MHELELLQRLLRSVYKQDGTYYPDFDFDSLIEDVKEFLSKETK